MNITASHFVMKMFDWVSPSRSPRTLVRVGILAGFGLMSGCSASEPVLPRPRPIVNYQGARIRADYEEMKSVNEWVTREQENIVNDPSFWVVSNATLGETLPWEGMRLAPDSVIINVPLGWSASVPDIWAPAFDGADGPSRRMATRSAGR